MRPRSYTRLFLSTAILLVLGCDSDTLPEKESWRFCEEMAACPDGAHEVETQSECPQGDVNCFEVSDCGRSVWCWEEEEGSCDAEPVCPEYADEVESCPEDDDHFNYSVCFEESVCGQSVFCVEQICLDVEPQCPAGAQNVGATQSQCPQGDGRCYEVSDCGGTVWCWEEEVPVCNGRPQCPEYADEVESCPADDDPNFNYSFCFEESKCGHSVFCVNRVCLDVEPQCPQGARNVGATQSQCPQGDGRCYELSDCGGTVWCWEEEDMVCDEEPECPEGYDEVNVCLDLCPCEVVEECGRTVACQDPNCLG